MNTDDTDQQDTRDGMYARIIEILDAFRRRKDPYISPVSPEEAEKFLYGFDTGCVACGVLVEWQACAERRGWRLGAIGPITQMRERGMTDDAIIDELISFRQDAIGAHLKLH
jgi:hypothetical protein